MRDFCLRYFVELQKEATLTYQVGWRMSGC
jgi:hypothetical protein